MRTIKAIWRQSLAEFMIYRGTSIITFVLATVFLLIELFTGQIYFSQRENLAGWTANRYFIMISFMNSATYLYNLFFILGHEGLGEDILEGNLDYLLVRPSSSYWLAVGRSLDIPSFFNLLLSLGLLAYYLIREGASFGQIMLINCMIVLPAALIFILNQLCLTLLFWFEGLTALGGIVEDLVSLAGRPKQIFPRVIQQLFTWIIPLLLVSNLPVDWLLGRGKSLLIYLLAFLTILYWLSVKFWQWGLRHYSSAN